MERGSTQFYTPIPATCSILAEKGIDSLQKVCLGVVSKTDSSKVLITARTDRLFRARLEHLSR